MKPRPSVLLAAVALLAAVLAPGATASAQQATAAAGNVSIKLTLPAGVQKVKGVLTFTQRGLATDHWFGNPAFQDLAKRLEAGMAVVSGGDDLNDGSYPNRCKSGEFNAVPDAFTKLAMMTNHPELANVPLVTLGHSHGGDYWNWFNACHPERVAMVFVHASGGVNYSAAALKTPVFYTLGTDDLKERGSGMPRAGMFVNRAKGAPMSLVIQPGGHDSDFTPEGYQLITALIEGIFKLRVPADADASKGPVVLNEINEASGQYWVGDIYTKEISRYADFKGNKALTSFLPTEELANKWKATGPALPMDIKLPGDHCGWCGDPKDEPKTIPVGTAPPPPNPSSGGSDGSAPTPAPDPGTGSTPPPAGGYADASAAPSPTPTPTPTGGGDTTPPPVTPRKKATGGCSVAGGETELAPLALLGLAALLRRRRR
jgi:MYXO-CTERM domain-containing protein